jgi:hypothetical protein
MAPNKLGTPHTVGDSAHNRRGVLVITKRMVGIALALLGLAIAGATLAVDLIGAGKWGGLGPAQQVALVVGVALSLTGLSLIPLGDRSA